jgi:hypothetical protein
MDNEFDIVPAAAPAVLRDDQARVNVTFAGLNGELADAMSFDADDAAVRMMISEALRFGSIRGIPAQQAVDLTNYVIDRFPATADYPNRIMLRPKTAFGA